MARLADRAAEDIDPFSLGEGDDGALGVRPLAPAEPRPAPLAGPVDRVDTGHPDPEDGLDRLPDLGLVGTGRDDERVLAVIRQPVALLRDDRLEQDVPRIGDLAHDASSEWRGLGRWSVGSGESGGSGESAASASPAGAHPHALAQLAPRPHAVPI